MTRVVRPAAMLLVALVIGCGRHASTGAEPALRVEGADLRVLPTGGGVLYLRVQNGSGEDDRLVGIDSPSIRDVQLHELALEGDLMTMREASNGFPVPAHDALVLARGGKHAMLFGVDGGVHTRVPLTLRFARSRPLTVSAPVESGMEP